MAENVSEEWDRYGRAVIGSMAEVLDEAVEEDRPLPLEAAVYWLSLGLATGRGRTEDAARLLALIEANPSARAELDGDAAALCEEALG